MHINWSLIFGWINNNKNSNNKSHYIYTINPLYNHTFGDHFIVTLKNCDLNVYITLYTNPYKIMIIGKINKLQKNLFMLE